MMSGEVGKLVGQFRSFGFAAVQRILLSGLQQRDAAALSGAVLSVGLGMGVYALKTMQYGGELSDDPTQWLVEGVNRSRLFGWLMDINNTAEKLSRGRLGIAALTGESVSRYQSRNWVEAMARPSVGLIQDANQVLGSAISGDWRESDTRAIRRILPYQNLFYLRGLFDAVEDGVNQGLGVN